MRATIIIPTFNHGCLIPVALRSLLRQSHQDFEAFIIGDGITEETRKAIMETLAWDTRLVFVDREKSPRHGELYRHEILMTQATGDAVCYLSDDDLWLPNHLKTILDTLEYAEIAHARSAVIHPTGEVSSSLVDWGSPSWREWTLQPQQNAVSLSNVGHRLSLYRRLPHGWRTTPSGIWSDHYMWQQMLIDPAVTAKSTGQLSLIAFPSTMRREHTLIQRYEEMIAWEQRLVTDAGNLHRDLEVATAEWFFHLHEIRMLLDQARQEVNKIHDEWGDSLHRKRNEISRKDSRIATLKERLALCEKELQGSQQQLRSLPNWLRRLLKQVRC